MNINIGDVFPVFRLNDENGEEGNAFTSAALRDNVKIKLTDLYKKNL